MLKASDVFVFPSKFEGLPGAVIEALAARLPVVASDLPSIREIAAECGGVLPCGPDDVDSFGRAIRAVLADRPRHEPRLEKLHERFSMAKYLERISTLYECPRAFVVPAGNAVPGIAAPS